MPETSFIIIDSLIGQYTIDFCTPDLTFFVIKKFAVEQSWDLIKGDEKCYYPVLSKSPKELEVESYIEEDLPLSKYNLQNGGVIFIHYIDVNLEQDGYPRENSSNQ